MECNENSFFYKLSKVIVQKRNLVYLIFAITVIYSLISIPKVQVDYNIVDYLPDTSETKQSVDIMEEEFTTFGTAQVMVSNITYDEAEKIFKSFDSINDDNIKSIEFDNTDRYYLDGNARFVFTFATADGSDEASKSISNIRELLSDYTVDIIATANSAEYAAALQHDIGFIIILAVIIIAIMTAYTSVSYIEVIIYFIVFGVAAVMNMGSNYLLGTISFISNSVAIILQLALAIDYAIILSHRFTAEKSICGDPEKAAIIALSKAIPEISASSLTTIAGMVAMMFMQLQIGLDLGLVLSKAIICSLITVFFLMPGLLVMFSKLMDKTKHRNLVPKISKFTIFNLKYRHITPVIFVVVVILCFNFQKSNEFVYSLNAIDAIQETDTRIEKENVEAIFGKSNIVAVVMPKGDYDSERGVLEEVGALEKVNEASGLANTKINDDYDYYITDKLTIKQFSEALDISTNEVEALYVAYAIHNNDYSVANIDNYAVQAMEMIDFIHDNIDNGIISLDDDKQTEFEDVYQQLEDGKAQTLGENYSRVVFNLNTDVEGDETFELLNQIRNIVNKYYDSGAYLAGESTSSYDLSRSFVGDNNLILILTILFVLVILLFTFKSIGAPLLLIIIIQGAIWINFSFPYIQGSNVFFFTTLIVSSIQMGATIDYAIVVTSKFQSLRLEGYNKFEAIVESMNANIATIITSGSILTIAGYLIAYIVSDPIVSGIGLALGRGTIISIACVLVILPQVLVLTTYIIDKTSFDLNLRDALGIDRKNLGLRNIQIVVNRTEEGDNSNEKQAK